jgi:glycosyltransferase involved in cell wall biosynthesis
MTLFNTPHPLTFSVVVNTTDRAEPLRALLNALEHQSYRHFEVIVVVGPTRDHTLNVLSAYETRVRVLRCPKANLSMSRNIGLRAANGDIVSFIDDDATPSRNWLAQLAQVFADATVDGTGGTTYITHGEKPGVQHRLGQTSALAEQRFVRASGLDEIVPEGVSTFWVTRMIGTNMAYRRAALLAMGGFDEFFEWVYDEADVCLRLTEAGRIVQPVREAVVYHHPASSRNRANANRSGFGKWWIQLKSSTYFSWKHGRANGSTTQEIGLRTLHLAHGHQLWLGQLRQKGRVSTRQLLNLRARGVWAAAQGTWAGLNASAKHASEAAAQDVTPASKPIALFQTDHSPLMPAPAPSIHPTHANITLPEPPLRIALVSSAYPPAQVDGVGRLTQLMARGLGELGHAVHVIANGEHESVTYADHAWVHRVPTDRSRYAQFRHLPQLFQTLNRSHTVHQQVQRLRWNESIQLVDSPLWLSEGVVTAMSGLLPVVVRLVTAGRQIAEMNAQVNQDRWLSSELERTLIERATHVLPNTEGTLANARKAYDVAIPDDRCTIVPYGIVPVADELTRPFELEAQRDAFTVLFVGRLEKRKGIIELFEAIPAVLAAVPHVRFVIAGADNSRHDGFFERNNNTYPGFFAKTYAAVADRVAFLGAVSDEQLTELYQTCDLFVAPSLYESFGLIYLEAMNYAKPVIGCRAGGVSEVVAHGVSGLLVEPGQARPLAEAIIGLLRSPAQLREMGLAGRAQVVKTFNYVHMARNFATAYRLAIQRHIPNT